MLRLSVDVGGTFTDLVLVDDGSGQRWMEKAPTTPGSAEGVMHGLKQLAARAQAKIEDIDLFVHGFTIATNAWITRTGADVLLLVTRGFRDILEVAHQRRPHIYSLTAQKPVPLVARSQVAEVSERIDAFGKIVEPLSSDEIERILAEIAARRPEAIAVSLLFSFANDTHERALAASIRERFPDIPIFLSCDVNPQIEEYPRANTSAASAYVGPPVARYTKALEDAVAKAGMYAKLVYMRSDGGVATPDSARQNPCAMLMSGPAGGVIAAVEAGRALGVENLVTLDIGGTSADIATISRGAAMLSRGRDVDGLPLRSPTLDITAISAGGGSIGRVDRGGALHVGPQSAGSVPGPACYGRGGTKPTLTDAALVLGYLDSKAFAGGIELSVEAAAQAIDQEVGGPLGRSTQDAALGMFAIANANMGEAIRTLAMERGYDLREFALLAFGGAGGLFGSFLVQDLGLRELIVPPTPGVFAAIGLQFADIRHHKQIPFPTQLANLDPAALSGILLAAENELREQLSRDGIATDRQRILFSADQRYQGQYHEINVVLADGSVSTLPDARGIAARFHEAHDLAYGYANPDATVEITNLRIDAIGVLDKPTLGQHGEAGNPQPAGTRDLFFEIGGAAHPTPIYLRDDIGPGSTVEGPAIIQQYDSTTVVLPGQVAEGVEHGFIRIKAA
ncbi:hydantoinase/oxoprolinase family protein [Borborobacter arsenicus]|nr:hydantoinase/oxoprolinase family protein [Pseudaminobacter arsenicus]